MSELMRLAERALEVASRTMLETYQAHEQGRCLVPDEEEGLPARIFAHHINATDRPLIQAMGTCNEAIAALRARSEQQGG